MNPNTIAQTHLIDEIRRIRRINPNLTNQTIANAINMKQTQVKTLLNHKRTITQEQTDRLITLIKELKNDTNNA